MRGVTQYTDWVDVAGYTSHHMGLMLRSLLEFFGHVLVRTARGEVYHLAYSPRDDADDLPWAAFRDGEDHLIVARQPIPARLVQVIGYQFLTYNPGADDSVVDIRVGLALFPEGLEDPPELAVAKQPPPLPGDAKVLDLVMYDLELRAAVTSEEYGSHLMTFNGRNPLLDAYQEALDLTMYLRQALEEQREKEAGVELSPEEPYAPGDGGGLQD